MDLIRIMSFCPSVGVPEGALTVKVPADCVLACVSISAVSPVGVVEVASAIETTRWVMRLLVSVSVPPRVAKPSVEVATHRVEVPVDCSTLPEVPVADAPSLYHPLTERLVSVEVANVTDEEVAMLCGSDRVTVPVLLLAVTWFAVPVSEVTALSAEVVIAVMRPLALAVMIGIRLPEPKVPVLLLTVASVRVDVPGPEAVASPESPDR